MSRATLYVRFPDGSLRYGLYNGTGDFAYAELTDTPGHAWDGVQDTAEPGAEQPVDVATDYGSGFAWTGTATRTELRDGVHPWDHDNSAADAGADRPLPSWAAYPKERPNRTVNGLTEPILRDVDQIGRHVLDLRRL